MNARKTAFRAALPFAATALVASAALGLLPLAGRTPEVAGALLTGDLFAFIPLIAIAAGVLAGRAAVRQHGGTAGDGALAGLFVGAGVLLGAVVGLTALGAIVGNFPEVQELVRNSEPHPEARLPYDWIAPLGAATGALIGFLSGLTYLVPTTLAGLVAATLGEPTRRPTTPQTTS
jgi:ABC-type Na+ efflux pump permease subunit